MAISGIRFLVFSILTLILFIGLNSCGEKQGRQGQSEVYSGKSGSDSEQGLVEDFNAAFAVLVSPECPRPGESFRILATGDKNISKAQVVVIGPSGREVSVKSSFSEGLPAWRIDDFPGCVAGKYRAVLTNIKKELATAEFTVSSEALQPSTGTVWKTRRSWDAGTESLYSAWINSLFSSCDERSSWPALHDVTRNKDMNFLYNYHSLDEDNPEGKNSVVMQPDCADNPFYLRAYFAWKLGLPFGYHVCDRGSLVRNPGTGQWITNESGTSKSNPVQAFNLFLRRVMDGVHSGTGRTSLDNENSDYYPVPLTRSSVRPGVVFADPYGHTLVVVRRIPQTRDRPGMLLSVDAQPDGTVGVKRFWKGNFLFTTSEVVGEPGFKAFRPILLVNGNLEPVRNNRLSGNSGFIPFSLEQRKMESEVFYHTMERIINPDPLDPESALLDLIKALHEQLVVRITSVANGEAYMTSHPGIVIAMPTSPSAIFLAGGQWEDFSTPNRDLRLLIAMDAVLGFPEKVFRSPGDYTISRLTSPEQVKKKLEDLLARKTAELSISYTRTDGSVQNLTLSEILARKDAFEMAYNPNDGVEIRWGAPENSVERSTCKRRAPVYQAEKMQVVRTWFRKRLHPPT